MRAITSASGPMKTRSFSRTRGRIRVLGQEPAPGVDGLTAGRPAQRRRTDVQKLAGRRRADADRAIREPDVQLVGIAVEHGDRLDPQLAGPG
jgi:hypothetical protein